MGQGWSKRLDDWMFPQQRYHYNAPSQPSSSSSSSFPLPPPPPSYVHQPPSYPPQQFPRPQLNGYNYYYQYPAPNYQYYPPNRGPYWWPAPPAVPYPAPASMLAPRPPATPYVEHQQAIKIKNYINLQKDTISLKRDDEFADQWLVSFTFDALLDGSFTVYFFAKEGENSAVVPMNPGIYNPSTESFQKGPGQKFCQSSGQGVNLGFFDHNSLSKPSHDEVYPLVVRAEARKTDSLDGESQNSPDSSSQITFAVIERSGEGFKVKVIKQILWVNRERYELREIFGLSGASNDDAEGEVVGKECVICMSEPSDTAVMPCRHMCMCGECAKTFRMHSSNCPICRGPVQELMEIKVNSG